MQRTELSLFRQEFRGALGALAAELAGTAARLERLGRSESALDPQTLARGLASAAGELQGLLTRVEGERSAVFVFGPPKAGKSTLVNALAGRYALEVGPRPSYPCVQRVGHAPEPGAALVRFDGTSERVPEQASLRLALQRVHADLAQAARATRAKGENFEPARHLRGAVRRVDRQLASEHLERTSVELVECPALTGPLFQTYSSMLVGESDGARAALFVARASQLCDDGVLFGFDQLLELFERVLVVVNLDGRAKDLDPTGALVPGAEGEDPLRLLEAFETLTTAPELGRALHDGRVRLIALDALEAARARLAGEEESAAAGAGLRLSDLLSELSERLDGHSAFRTFVHSALRRAGEALEETHELLVTPGLAELPRAEERAEAERAARERIDQALRRLASRARRTWESEGLFVALRERLGAKLAQRGQELARELAPSLAATIEDWFSNSESVRELMQNRLAPRVAGAQADLARFADAAVRAQLAEPALLASLSPELKRDLGEARVDLAALLRPAAEAQAPAPQTQPPLPLDVEKIPVRARLGERLTMRSEAEVRRALFGPPELPGLVLSSADKEKRLGRAAQSAMRKSAEARAATALAERAKACTAQRQEATLTAFVSALEQHVQRELARLERPLRELAARVEELRALNASTRALEQAAAGLGSALEELTQRFPVAAAAAPAATLVPQPRRAPSEARPPARRASGIPAAE